MPSWSQNAMPYRKLFDGRGAFGKYDDDDMMRLAARVSAYASRRDSAARWRSCRRPNISSWRAASSISASRTGRPASSSTRTRPLRWLEAQPEA